MTRKYKRIPLTVDALFLPDGTFKPRKLIHNTLVRRDNPQEAVR